MNTYPMFTPPEDLAVIGAKNWKKKEAQRYFDWLMSEKSTRVDYFLKYIGYVLTSNDEKDLKEISPLLYTSINNDSFYSIREFDNAKQLNDMGLAMACDMGLLLAQLLQESKPQLYWEIGKGPKTYHSYNLPVLKQFVNREWDLLFTSISKNGYSLNELKQPYDWFTFYNDLKSKAL
jgi:hypothetical protein